MADILDALHFLNRRINSKEKSLGIFDITIIESAIFEIRRLRSHEAVMEAEMQKIRLEYYTPTITEEEVSTKESGGKDV